MSIPMSEEHRAEALVSTQWVENHRNETHLRLVEVDMDREAYDQAHIEGAVGWSWQTDLCDRIRRDIIPEEALDRLLSKSGITNDTTIVIYGDNNNWFACWAYWQLSIYGHRRLRIMDGGRKKWIAEGRPLTKEVPTYPAAHYMTRGPDVRLRAFLPDVMRLMAQSSSSLVDARTLDEFTGRVLAPAGAPETCQRGGHIPGAVSIPWDQNCRQDGSFKSREELARLYESRGVTPDKDVVAYCRIGERSSLTWFVLKELLGYERVRNYDGSWTEWGNLVRAPVERPPR